MYMKEHPEGRQAHDAFMAEQLFGSCMDRDEVQRAFRKMSIPAENRCFYVSILTPVNLLECARRENLGRYDMLHLAATEVGRCCGELATDDFWILSGALPSEVVVLFSVCVELFHRDRRALEQQIAGTLQRVMETCNISGVCWRAYTSHPTLEFELLSQTFDQARELVAAAVMLGNL